MRAAVFIRYHSGDGFGHVGWAFEMDGLVNAGSVENHSGHIFTPATKMGFWNGCFEKPVEQMRERGYDDLKWIDVERADPERAYRTVLWIKHEAYKALHRNCEDDVYDVLRAYGVEDLTSPSLIWFPKSWFKRFRGELEHLGEFRWETVLRQAQDDIPIAQDDIPIAQDDIPIAHGDNMWRPTWRRPWHRHFHALNVERLTQAFARG